jgi:hypothetical protein
MTKLDLLQNGVVFGVRADPKPHDRFAVEHSHGALT